MRSSFYVCFTLILSFCFSLSFKSVPAQIQPYIASFTFVYVYYVCNRSACYLQRLRSQFTCFNTFIIYSFVIACFIYASFWLCIFLVVTAHKFDMISQADIISNSFAFVRPTLVLPPFCLLSLCLLSPKVFARNSPCFNPFQFAITLYAITMFIHLVLKLSNMLFCFRLFFIDYYAIG